MIKKIQAAGCTLAELKKLIQADEAHELPLQKIVELLRQKMEKTDRKQAKLEQIQTYLAQMLALMEDKEKGDVGEEYLYIKRDQKHF